MRALNGQENEISLASHSRNERKEYAIQINSTLLQTVVVWLLLWRNEMSDQYEM